MRFKSASDAQKKIAAATTDEYLALLDEAYKAHSVKLKDSAAGGTDMHAELEEYVKFTLSEYKGEPKIYAAQKHPAVQLFADWAVKNVKKFLVSEGHCYSEKLWTGGICDLLFEDKEGRLVIMVFKSSKEAYLSQFFQTAGDDAAITENGLFDENGICLCKPDREISYYAIFPFGMENPEPQFHFDTKGAQEGFKAATILHKLINNQT